MLVVAWVANINLEEQLKGTKGLWFSRAGRYDRSHGGTYGNPELVPILQQLAKNSGVPIQVSAGWANVGHSNGRGGEHADPSGMTVDLGLSGLNTQQRKKLLNAATSMGYNNYLYEDPNGPNAHYHFRFGKGGKPKAVASKPGFAQGLNMTNPAQVA